MNQTSCAGSPQPQVKVFAGCPDQTCHHRTTAGTVNRAMTPRWKPTALAGRARPLLRGEPTSVRLSYEEAFARESVALVSPGSTSADACLPIVTPPERSA